MAQAVWCGRAPTLGRKRSLSKRPSARPTGQRPSPGGRTIRSADFSPPLPPSSAPLSVFCPDFSELESDLDGPSRSELTRPRRGVRVSRGRRAWQGPRGVRRKGRSAPFAHARRVGPASLTLPVWLSSTVLVRPAGRSPSGVLGTAPPPWPGHLASRLVYPRQRREGFSSCPAL